MRLLTSTAENCAIWAFIGDRRLFDAKLLLENLR